MYKPQSHRKNVEAAFFPAGLKIPGKENSAGTKNNLLTMLVPLEVVPLESVPGFPSY